MSHSQHRLCTLFHDVTPEFDCICFTIYLYCMCGQQNLRFVTSVILDITSVCPWVVGIIVNDDQQDATILVYLFNPNQPYVFRAMSSPIIRSTWLYLQHLILSIDIAAAGVTDEMEQFHLIRDISRKQYRWTISDAVNTVKCSMK